MTRRQRSGGGQRRDGLGAAARIGGGCPGHRPARHRRSSSAQLDGGPDARSPRFWVGLAAAAALTIVSLMLRSLRWIFLLRRAETRIPIRDAYIGYFAGLSLLLAPFLLGEIAVRAAVLRARGRVPDGDRSWSSTCGSGCSTSWRSASSPASWPCCSGGSRPGPRSCSRCCLLTAVPPVLPGLPAGRGMAGAAAPHIFRRRARHSRRVRLSEGRTWLVAHCRRAWSPGPARARVLAASRAAGSGRSRWCRPSTPTPRPSSSAAWCSRQAACWSPERGCSTSCTAAGLAPAAAAFAVLGIRLATVGVATALGVVFLLVHVRTATCGRCGAFRRDRRRLRRADSRIAARRAARDRRRR